MALGIMGLMVLGIIIVTIIALVVVLFGQGRLVKNDYAFMVIQAYLALLAGLKIAAVADNDWLGQGMGYALLVAAVSAIFVKKRSFFAARMMLVVLLILALVINYL